MSLSQLADPMNVMLVIVAIISLLIGQVSVGIVVGALVILNVFLGASQEMKAKASVDALSKMQIPKARVFRDGSLLQIASTDVVPGDIVALEAGDIVPADGRILRSATLETQEAALTGESAPIPKDDATIADPDTTLGDRANSVFQNTQVTRGTATVVITDTGMTTQMGQIASMLSSVKQAKSPLQRELDSLTGVLGWIAWGAVAVIVIFGLVRDQPLASVILLGISMAISAIPTGMPSFVQAMLSFGSRQLAEHNAVVKNLTDVETLGATSAINSDKTGTLTMNEMTVESLYLAGEWYTVGGSGYEKTGEILQVAGSPTPTSPSSRSGLTLCSDATVSDDGDVIGDPTEAALVVLAAKMGADAELTRAQYPRAAEVPFDSAYKFMATFHEVTRDGAAHLVELVKGGPDVVLDRCSTVATADGPVSIDKAARHRPRREPQALRAGPAGARVRRPPLRARHTGPRGSDGRGEGPRTGRPRRHHRPAPPLVEGGRAHRPPGRHRCADDHGRPRDHGCRDRREARPRTRCRQRRRHPGDDGRRAQGGPAEPARVRPGDPRRQAAPRPPHAGERRRRRHDRRRRERRRRAQAGRHRRRDGVGQRGHEAGREDDPGRRQLRHPGHGRQARPGDLRQDRQLRPLPDVAAVLAGAALPRREHLRHQQRRAAARRS